MEEEEFTLADSKVNYKDRANRKKAAGDKAFDTNIEDLVEQEDEADDTVFIDNLPKDEASLRYMIKEVNYHIRDLERQFFIEEDSEVEEDLKQNLRKKISAAEHNEALMQLKQRSHIQQFWSIPLSENVTGLAWDELANAQKRHAGGQLFDVITCDPPWQLSSANPTRGVAIAYETLNDKQILDIPFAKL